MPMLIGQTSDLLRIQSKTAMKIFSSPTSDLRLPTSDPRPPISVPRLPHFLFAALLILFIVSVGRADTIVLKDGRKIHCDSAREEEKIVRYWIGDSMLTVARDKVERIERDSQSGEGLASNNSATSADDPKRRLSERQTLLPETQPGGTSLSAEALSKLETNLKADPSDLKSRADLIAALNRTAYTEYEAGNYSRAKEFLERSLALDSRNSETHTIYAVIGIKESRYTDAASHAASAVESDPKNASALYLSGVANYALEKLPEAVKAFKAALEIKKNPIIEAALEKAERDLAVSRDFTTNRSRFFNIGME